MRGEESIVGDELDEGFEQLFELAHQLAVGQRDVFAAAIQFARTEGILPAPESSHAILAAINEAVDARDKNERRVILFNLSGHGFLDLSAYDQYLHNGMINGSVAEGQLEGLEELETMPGQKLYLVTGQLEGRHLYDLSYGMMTDGKMTAKLWIDPITFDLYRMEMTEQTGSPDGEKVWVIEFWNINTTAEIQPPDMTTEQP